MKIRTTAMGVVLEPFPSLYSQPQPFKADPPCARACYRAS